MKIRYIFLFFIILFVSCQEDFTLESGLNKNILVVNGMIDNDSPPYTIKLSRTSDAGDPFFIPETGAELNIIDQDGNTEQLSETKPGIYKTSETGMKGEIGNSYKLNVKLSDGNEYETDFQPIEKSVDIDSVYYEKEYQENRNFLNGLPGYRFYVNTKQAEDPSSYFLWKMTETFEYDTDYELAYMEDKWGNRFYNVPKYDTIETCWQTNDINLFTTSTTVNLSSPVILKKQLNFVGCDTKKLTIIYSLLVKQFVINKAAFDFWNLAETQLSEDNFLTGYQPYNIQGNLKNKKNEKEQVYGYFTVASVSEKRIYVNRIYAPFFFQKCITTTDPDVIANYKITHQPPYFYVYIFNEDGQMFEALLFYPDCLDCRNEGGTITKPDFWIYF